MSWNVGDLLKEIKKAPITRDHLRSYAEASWDDNPIHLDEEVAKSQALPSVIVHGMISMAFLADEVRANFSTKEYRLLSLRTRFRKVTYPGDQLTCSGQIKALTPEGNIQVTVWTTNQNGEKTCDGEATLQPI